MKVDIIDHQLMNDKVPDKELIDSFLKMDAKQLEAEGYKDFKDYITKNGHQDNASYLQSTSIKDGQRRFLKMNISVIDTGIGISENGIKKLFIDFSKLDESS